MAFFNPYGSIETDCISTQFSEYPLVLAKLGRKQLSLSHFLLGESSAFDMVSRDAACACIYECYSYKMHVHRSLFQTGCGSFLGCKYFCLVYFAREELFLWGGMWDGEHEM